jgi:hypothetical protein
MPEFTAKESPRDSTGAGMMDAAGARATTATWRSPRRLREQGVAVRGPHGA